MKGNNWEQSGAVCPYYSLSNVKDNRICCSCKTKNTRMISMSFSGKRQREEHMRSYCMDVHGYPLCPIFETVFSLEACGSTAFYNEKLKKEIKDLYF